ncbi:MAG: LamG domain-containing protein, partial [Bacteroidales bacterium]|nr:LamG domain-containing protein [Bacteroidales bacterium]
DGNQAYVEYPEGKVYFDGSYSISIWVKWEECHVWDRILDFNQIMPQAGNAVTWRIGSNVDGKANSLWLDQWVLDNDNNPVSSIISLDNVPADAGLGYSVKLGQWDHYVVVYDVSASNPQGVKHNEKGQEIRYRGAVTLYVNGKKVGQNNHCFNPQPIPTVANWLGRSRYQGDPHFKGWMDDFRIYDRKLSASEVQTLYKLGAN